MEERLVGRGKLWPEFIGAVDDRAGSECHEGRATDGDAPWFEVVPASVQTKHSAFAEFGKGHLSECSDGEPAPDCIGGAADAGFTEDAEQSGDGGTVGVWLAENQLIEVLQAGFAGPWSEGRSSPVAEPVGGGEQGA